MTNQEAEALLNRYLRGECTPAEKLKLEEWYDLLPEKDLPAWESAGRLQLRDEIKSTVDAEIDGQQVKGRVISLRIIWAAASVILLCALGVLLKQYLAQANSNGADAAYIEKVVPPGEKMNLVLSDNTTIILNGSSKIRYPETFKGKIREVTLVEGEAFFDVKHDPSKPFIVNAKGTRINVLGTAFDVRAYKFLKNVQVTVTRGKVSVIRLNVNVKQPVVTLLPNEQVTVNESVSTIMKKHIHSEDYTGWIQGKYRFDDETLGNVANELESYYKVNISFTNDSLKNIRFSSEFDSTDRIEDLLFDICKANNLSYTMKDQTIVFSTRR